MAVRSPVHYQRIFDGYPTSFSRYSLLTSEAVAERDLCGARCPCGVCLTEEGRHDDADKRCRVDAVQGVEHVDDQLEVVGLLALGRLGILRRRARRAEHRGEIG